jgi:hypothetical protein
VIAKDPKRTEAAPKVTPNEKIGGSSRLSPAEQEAQKKFFSSQKLTGVLTPLQRRMQSSGG